MNRQQGRIFVTALGAAFALGHPAAHAQGTPQRVERIEVTGSNIKRVDTEGVSPVQVITKQEIEQSGKSTVADMLRTISANSSFSLNEVFTNSFSPGAAGLSLRGLGQKSTLVLLNGRRMANYGFAQNLQDTYVDLNSLPATAIERIEVLKDGASAIYGSDAIGGVVNIILRSDYRGAEISGSGGTSTEGGLNEARASLAAGYGDRASQRFNVLATLDYLKRDLLLATDRDFTRDQDTRRFQGGSLNWASVATYRTNPRTPFPSCGVNNPGTPVPGNQLGSNGTLCAYNPASTITLFPETERLSFLGRAVFDLTAATTAYAEVAASGNRTFQTAGPSSISPTSVAFDPATGGIRTVNGTLPVGNPSNPFTTPVGINYAFFDVGPRESEIESRSWRVLAGLKGTAAGWDWDAGLLAARNEVDQANFNRVDSYVIADAIARGTYNFLSPATGAVTAEQLRINPQRRSTSKLEAFDLKGSRELGQLAGGPIGIAAGIDYRREAIQDRPDAITANGNVLGQGAVATDGSRSVKAAFVEMSAPVHRQLELQLAGRYDSYSDFGNAFSPKAGFKWTPAPSVILRGSASKGFRAPTLPENAQSSATFFTQVIDTDPASPAFNRTVTIAGVFAGNKSLDAEKSKHLNLGVVYEPDPDFNVGVGYFKIRQNGIVLSSGFQFITSNPHLFPGQVLRAADGTLVAIFDKFQNIEYLETSGVDLDLRKAWQLPWGKLTLTADWTYTGHFKSPQAPGQPATDYVDSNFYPPSGSGIPRHRGRIGLAFASGPWNTALTRLYNHSWDQQNASVPPAQERVGAYTQYDLYVSYQGFKNLKLYASVQNLLDTDPPFDPTNGGTGTPVGHDIGQNDLRGRYVTLGASYSFR